MGTSKKKVQAGTPEHRARAKANLKRSGKYVTKTRMKDGEVWVNEYEGIGRKEPDLPIRGPVFPDYPTIAKRIKRKVTGRKKKDE